MQLIKVIEYVVEFSAHMRSQIFYFGMGSEEILLLNLAVASVHQEQQRLAEKEEILHRL